MVRKKEGGNKNLKNYLFLVVFLFLLVLSFFIIRPYFVALISAFILAYLLRPIFIRLRKRLGKVLAALVCILIAVLVVILPLGAVFGGIARQSSDYLSGGNFDKLIEWVFSLPLLAELNLNLGTVANEGMSFLISLFTSAISYLPSLIITLIIVLFGMYYILTNWELLAKNLREYIPFKNKKEVAKEMANLTNNLVYGTFFIAFVEFVVAILGFYLLGINFFLLLAALIFFLAFIPGLGPVIVWVPLTLIYILIGDYGLALGVIIIGLLLSFGVDTILRSKLLGDRTKISPLIMLVGILGGISVFGVFGFIIGPLVLIYTLKLLEEVMKNA